MLQTSFFALLIVVLSVALPYDDLFFDENDTNNTKTSNFTNLTTVLSTSFTTVNITTAMPTTNPMTTAQLTTNYPIVNDSTEFTSQTTFSPMNSTAVTTTKSILTTTVTIGRKFDGLSFIGGMILAAGLCAILFLVVSYLRRNQQLPYSNLR